MFSPHGMPLFKAGDAACFREIRLGRRCVKHHDRAVGSGTLLVPKSDRIYKALRASVRVLAMLVSFGTSYLARMQDFWQDMFCKDFVFFQVYWNYFSNYLVELLVPRSSRSGKAFEHLLFCPDLSEMLLPADPSFSPKESHSAQYGAAQSSPLPQSRLIHRLNFAAAFLLQLSEVSQHNLLVPVVLPFCWLVELLF